MKILILKLKAQQKKGYALDIIGQRFEYEKIKIWQQHRKYDDKFINGENKEYENKVK
jgi:hypothetical protein